MVFGIWRRIGLASGFGCVGGEVAGEGGRGDEVEMLGSDG